jgi:hypothetical protein
MDLFFCTVNDLCSMIKNMPCNRYRLDRQFLSLDELHSIIIGLKGIRSTLDEQDIGGLLDKVGTLVSKSEQGAVTGLSNQMRIDPPCLDSA